MRRREVLTGICAVSILIILSLIAFLVYRNYVQRYNVWISHESGIYSDSFELEIEPMSSATIYYTTDGTKPDPQSDTTQIYKNPIMILLMEETAVYSYQFCGVFSDGTVSEIYERDFILDPEAEERFSTTYVISVTGDEEKLFGYEEGLFVRGRQFDEYMEANPDVDLLNTVIPANYLSDEEIGVHTAIFFADGTQIISQNCGLKIYGNVTRAKNQKSFRLIARTEYNDVNEFSYSFFPNLVSEEGKAPINAYQRLSLHNSGNDNGYAFMRTELIGELARISGYPDVLCAESATVYINGRYQGVYWLNNTFDDRYFSEKYGNYAGEFVVSEGALSAMDIENAETPLEEQHSNDYNSFSEWLMSADLQNEKDWQRVEETIDIQNFAQYMAIQYYICNKDWPHNNVKVYRYECAPGEEYREGSVFDGKYRYLLFDTDYGMGLKFLGWFGMDASAERLGELCESDSSAVLFGKLMEKEEFRNLFINSVLHVICSAFNQDTVSETLGKYNQMRYEELKYMMENTDILKNSLWEPDDNSIADVEAEMHVIRQFAEYRPSTIISELQSMWSCGNLINMNLTSQTGICLNGMSVDTEYDGVCFENVPIEITCDTEPGISVDGYWVGESYVEGEKLTLIPGEWVSDGETLVIKAVCQTEAVESLEIAEYSIRGTEDYIILRNNGQVPVDLADYSLTDSREDVSKGRLPKVDLLPQEEYVVYGREYSGMRVNNSIRFSYAWSTEEEIVLFHMTDGVVEIKNMQLQ